jgi:hypothetical protein
MIADSKANQLRSRVKPAIPGGLRFTSRNAERGRQKRTNKEASLQVSYI